VDKMIWDNDEKRLRFAVKYLRENGIKPNQGGMWIQKHLFIVGKRKLKLYLASGTTSLIKDATLLFQTISKDSLAYAELAEFLDDFEFSVTSSKDHHGHEHHYATLKGKEWWL
jgi:hypothetical protein